MTNQELQIREFGSGRSAARLVSSLTAPFAWASISFSAASQSSHSWPDSNPRAAALKKAASEILASRLDASPLHEEPDSLSGSAAATDGFVVPDDPPVIFSDFDIFTSP
jgi:hypothetical protein